MRAAIVIVFLALSISAPGIFEKWGPRGEWVWFIISVGFLYSIFLLLGDV